MGARIHVRLTPRSGRDAIAGWDGDLLLARVAAPPVDGKANAALVRLLAAVLRVPPSAISVVWGGTARMKVVEIASLSQADAIAMLAAATTPGVDT